MSFRNNLQQQLQWFNTLPKTLEKRNRQSNNPLTFATQQSINQFCLNPQQEWNKIDNKQWDSSQQIIGKTLKVKRKPEREFGVRKEKYSNKNTDNSNTNPSNQSWNTNTKYNTQNNNDFKPNPLPNANQSNSFNANTDTNNHMTGKRKYDFNSETVQPNKRRRLQTSNNFQQNSANYSNNFQNNFNQSNSNNFQTNAESNTNTNAMSEDLFDDLDDSVFEQIDVSMIDKTQNTNQNQSNIKHERPNPNHNHCSINIVNTTNNHSNINTVNMDLSGFVQLLKALELEREWMITMLDARQDYDGYQRWNIKLQREYTANITQMQPILSRLNTVPSLTHINTELNKERKLLLSLCKSYNPSARSQLIWNSDFKTSLEQRATNDSLFQRREQIIQSMFTNNQNIPNNQNMLSNHNNAHSNLQNSAVDNAVIHNNSNNYTMPKLESPQAYNHNFNSNSNANISRNDPQTYNNNFNSNPNVNYSNNNSFNSNPNPQTYTNNNEYNPLVSFNDNSFNSNNTNNVSNPNNFSYNNDNGNFGPQSTPPPSNSRIEHEYWSPSKNQDGMNTFIKQFDASGQMLYYDGYRKFVSSTKYDYCLTQILRTQFGYNKFRAYQREICTALLDGKDCLVIMPTGYGKSVTYQIPVLCREAMSSHSQSQTMIVISPLVSLIQDQVYQLQQAGIEAIAFGSIDMDDTYAVEESRQRWKEALNGKYKLIYITPEKLEYSQWMTTLISKLFDKGQLFGFAIDEAHCISQWGHDFRKSYLKLDKIKGKYGAQIPIIALTATATSTVIKDVITGLRIENCAFFQQNMNRPNLFWEVRDKTKKYKDAIIQFIRDTYPHKCGIIYCLSRKECEDLHTYLHSKRIKSVVYHAGLPDSERQSNQLLWTTDKVKIVIATCAFGMGINKYDVRFVIHTSIPKSIEDYYQQAGRAGRDGAYSRCILFFSRGDRFRIEFLISKSDEAKQRHFEAIERDKKKLWDMVYYCENSVDCRRATLLGFFGDKFDKRMCKFDCNTLEWTQKLKNVNTNLDKKHWRGCDNCNVHCLQCWEEENVTIYAKDICNIIKALQGRQNQKKSYDTVLKVFRGSKAKDITYLKGVVGYAKGKAKFDMTDTRRLIAKLLSNQIIKEIVRGTQFGGNTSEMCLGSKYSQILRGQTKIFLRLRQRDKETKNTYSKKVKRKSVGKKAQKKTVKRQRNSKKKKEKINDFYTEEIDQKDSEDSMDEEIGIDLTQNINHSSKMEINGFELCSLSDTMAAHLSESLDDLRTKIKDRHAIKSVFYVYSDVVMAQLAKYAPITLDDLSHFDGLNDFRINKYGERVIDNIREFIDANQIKSPFESVPQTQRVPNNSESESECSIHLSQAPNPRTDQLNSFRFSQNQNQSKRPSRRKKKTFGNVNEIVSELGGTSSFIKTSKRKTKNKKNKNMNKRSRK